MRGRCQRPAHQPLERGQRQHRLQLRRWWEPHRHQLSLQPGRDAPVWLAQSAHGHLPQEQRRDHVPEPW